VLDQLLREPLLLVVEPALLADVLDQREQPQRLAVVVADEAEMQPRPHGLAAAAQVALLDRVAVARPAQDGFEQGQLELVVVGVRERLAGPAEDLGAAVAEQPLRGRVHLQHEALRVEQGDPVRRGLDDLARHERFLVAPAGRGARGRLGRRHGAVGACSSTSSSRRPMSIGFVR
jgi:hypothetical protein